MPEIYVQAAQAYQSLQRLVTQHGLEQTITLRYEKSDHEGDEDAIEMTLGPMVIVTWTFWAPRLSRDTFEAMRCCILSATPAGCPEAHPHYLLPDSWRL